MLDYIQPANLVEWVENTAPFLFSSPVDCPASPLHELDFVAILHRVKLGYAWPEDREAYVLDYFALCLACHHATVATFIPTDVDSKIRGLLWRDAKDPATHRQMFALACRAMTWPLAQVSRRYTELAGQGPVSGHNGEQLSVLLGALQAFLRNGDQEFADQATAAVTAELEREAAEWQTAIQTRGGELDGLRIAMSLTHNAGDIDQGLSYWPKIEALAGPRAAFGRLAHENTKPFSGAFAQSAKVYKQLVASEGHRHYPLRSIKGLRCCPDLLLPLGPCFDEWGAKVAQSAALSPESKAETLGALISGCRKVPGQRGYYRAIRGFEDALGAAGYNTLMALLPNSLRKESAAAPLRKLVAVSRESFESSLRKAFRGALAG